MLSYKKEWRKHFFDVLGLAEIQKDKYSGFYTTVTNFSNDKLGYNNLQGGAIRPWDGTIPTTKILVWFLLWGA